MKTTERRLKCDWWKRRDNEMRNYIVDKPMNHNARVLTELCYALCDTRQFTVQHSRIAYQDESDVLPTQTHPHAHTHTVRYEMK